MLLPDLIKEQPLVGQSESLTVLNYDPRTTAQWILPYALGPTGVLASFERPPTLPSSVRAPAAPKLEIIDLSTAVFDETLGPVSLETLKSRLSKFKGRPMALLAPDVLIGAGRSADELLSFIQDIVYTNPLIIATAVSSALVDKTYETGVQQDKFITRLLYSANIVITVEPFKTGRADDATGVLTVRPGNKNSTECEYRQFMYAVTPNLSVNLTIR